LPAVASASPSPPRLSATYGVRLATIGLYGMVAYSVVQRRRELGVRIALGATARNVVTLVMRSAIVFVLAGAVAGVLGALAATRFIRTMLFQTTAMDVTTFVAVPLLLAGAAMSASYWSARRAATIDPMIAIKGK
jgi:putative ABC transport system permease protein